MADTCLRTEGDHEIWATPEGEEYKRWAKGNSLGRRPFALASRHPKTTEAIRAALSKAKNGNGKELDKSEITPSMFGAGLHLIKAQRQIERKAEAQRAAEFAMMQAAASSSPGNPKVPTEAWGLLAGNLTERALMDDNTGHAVSAVGMIGRMTGYLSDESVKAPQQAIQVNVTIEAGALDQAQALVEGRWSDLLQLPGGEDMQAPGDAQVDE